MRTIRGIIMRIYGALTMCQVLPSLIIQDCNPALLLFSIYSKELLVMITEIHGPLENSQKWTQPKSLVW